MNANVAASLLDVYLGNHFGNMLALTLQSDNMLVLCIQLVLPLIGKDKKTMQI